MTPPRALFAVALLCTAATAIAGEEPWSVARVRAGYAANAADFERRLDHGAIVFRERRTTVTARGGAFDGTRTDRVTVTAAVRGGRDWRAGDRREEWTHAAGTVGKAGQFAEAMLLTGGRRVELLRYPGDDAFLIASDGTDARSLEVGYAFSRGHEALSVPAQLRDLPVRDLLADDRAALSVARAADGPDGAEVTVSFQYPEDADVWYRRGSVTLLPGLGWAVRAYELPSPEPNGAAVLYRGTVEYGDERIAGAPVPTGWTRLSRRTDPRGGKPVVTYEQRRACTLVRLSADELPDERFTLASFPLPGGADAGTAAAPDAPPALTLGEATFSGFEQAGPTTATAAVTNDAAVPATVVGAGTACGPLGCGQVLTGLPVTLEPGASAELTAQLFGRPATGAFREEIPVFVRVGGELRRQPLTVTEAE